MPKVSEDQLAARRGEILDGRPAGLRPARLRGRDRQGARGRDRPVAGRDLPPLPRQGGAVPRPRRGRRRPHRRGRRARPGWCRSCATCATRTPAGWACSSRCAAGCAPTRRSPARGPSARRPSRARHRRAARAAARGRRRPRRRARRRCSPTSCASSSTASSARMAAGMPTDHLDGVLDLVEDAVRRPDRTLTHASRARPLASRRRDDARSTHGQPGQLRRHAARSRSAAAVVRGVPARRGRRRRATCRTA